MNDWMGVDNEKKWEEATLRRLKTTAFCDTWQSSVMAARPEYSVYRASDHFFNIIKRYVGAQLQKTHSRKANKIFALT
jgi:hypothetical protein